MIIILTTLHKKETALSIGKGLLESRLIACYNLFPIESAYWWKGKIIEEHETMMLMKTRDEHFDNVSAYIKEHSGYDVPEVICLPPEKVNESYLKWVTDETDIKS